MQKRLILKIESSPSRRGDKRECDYVSHSCLRRAIYTPPVTLHMEFSHTQSLSCVEYKEAEVGLGLVDTKHKARRRGLMVSESLS